MNKIKIIKTIALTAILSSMLLGLNILSPIFRHFQDLGEHFFIWFFTSLLALLGPFAAVLYEIPFFTYIPMNSVFIMALLIIVAFIIVAHRKNSDWTITFIKIITALWVSIGAYYTTIDVFLSV